MLLWLMQQTFANQVAFWQTWTQNMPTEVLESTLTAGESQGCLCLEGSKRATYLYDKRLPFGARVSIASRNQSVA